MLRMAGSCWDGPRPVVSSGLDCLSAQFGTKRLPDAGSGIVAIRCTGLSHGGHAPSALFDPVRDERGVGACLDAQLGDLQVHRRINVLAVEADGKACLLGQQVDPPVRTSASSASAAASSAPVRARARTCRRVMAAIRAAVSRVALRSCHTGILEHRFDSLPAPEAGGRQTTGSAAAALSARECPMASEQAHQPT